DNPERLDEIADIDAAAIRRGLDLKGGMYLVLEVDQEGMNTSEAADALLRVKEILYNRIDKFGVSEPEITTFGSSRIVVKLPGLQDPERAKALLGRTARLEFRMVRPDTEIQAVLDKLDRLYLGDSPVGEDSAEAADASAETEDGTEVAVAEIDSTAVAATDTASNPFGDLDDLMGSDESLAGADEAYLKDHPFTGLLIAQPGVLGSTPLFVEESNVVRVQAMLDDPRTSRSLRNMEFQLEMEPMDFGQGQMLRPLYLVDTSAILTGDQLTDALSTSNPDRPGFWQVNFSLNNRGSRTFAKVTGENVGRFLAISLDGRISSAPVIQGKIPSGSGSISGNFTNAEASDLALLLRAGALPTDVYIAEERTVGPSLGSDSIRMGVNAALYGSVLVILFILFYYRLSGVVTVLALVSNIIILMAVLAQFDLVLTLPGIAGIILTVGMAVDANVLINERIREELRKDKTIRASVQSGYANATRTIVDANITTLIAGGILLWFGTGPIKGFAVTLSIGILTSMFTALVMTRVVMEFLTRRQGRKKMSI
ncbi:MAG: protein translocase subunit SecD, partial [Acidobacteria bacterium]|nr:protein translocase subunit SecD [Candidatus Polarisedimenticola svalbardensis]